MARSKLSWVAAVAAAVVAVACGGKSPSTPSGNAGVQVQGVVLGDGVATPSGLHASAASSKPRVTVRVEGTSITATVSASGTFVLENAPAGTLTLIFERDGVEIGRLQVTAPQGGTAKIVVQIKGSTVTLVSVKVEDENGDDVTPMTCAIEGGKQGEGIELEGAVDSGTPDAFVMTVNGNRSSEPVAVDASGASFTCNGDKGNPDCRASLKIGAKVHVRGTLKLCTISEAQVTATEVKIQKAGDGV
jgi:hypothetical protein